MSAIWRPDRDDDRPLLADSSPWSNADQDTGALITIDWFEGSTSSVYARCSTNTLNVSMSTRRSCGGGVMADRSMKPNRF